jgi:hypothetical protein
MTLEEEVILALNHIIQLAQEMREAMQTQPERSIQRKHHHKRNKKQTAKGD